ncbi:secretory lipase [Apiospora phragmitis]|uniref:Secretory lipase n=1 Tax=Apiospora phragmitis TaxID=2905665 RepID=A0ABR1VYK0_9PEZI
MFYPAKAITALFLSGHASSASAQTPPAAEQSTGFNSTFALTPDQIVATNLSDAEATSLNNVLRFDRSQLANGGPHEDDFYTLPPLTNSSTGPLEPGTLLKTQAFTDPSTFAIPPNTALSRILYTTRTHNGTVVPATAFILWPFTARNIVTASATGNQHAQQRDKAEEKRSYDDQIKPTGGAGAPVVLWTHGTSGFFASAAPSSHRALWYGDAAPFTLALEGYAVVAPDYAGLGISTTWGEGGGDTQKIPHQYLMSRISARDGLYALRAARAAFAEALDARFVAMGHSQGGGAAWSVAEVLSDEEGKTPEEFADLAPGYRGAVAGSPTTDVFTGWPSLIAPFVALALGSVFPSFQLADWFTPVGAARVKLFRELEGSIGAAQQLFLGDGAAQLLKDGWNETWYVEAYGKLANAGRRPFRGPLLVLQGTEDVYVPYSVTNATVAATCAAHPDSALEFLVVNGTGHVPTLDATRQIWLDWIQDRFEGRPAATEGRGCKRTEMGSFLPMGWYLKVGNAFPQWAGAPEYSYQVPLGL